MADLDVQKKGPSIWPWIVGLIVLALVIWGVAELVNKDHRNVATTAPVAAPAPVPPAAEATPPTTEAATLAQVIADPTTYMNQTVSGQATVANVVSDRAFWVENGGQRMLVVLNESTPGATGQANVQGAPAEMPKVRSGETVQIANGTVHDSNYVPQIQGTLDAKTKSALQGQSAFLLADGANVQVSPAGQATGTNPTPGTTATPSGTAPGTTSTPSTTGTPPATTSGSAY